MPDDTTAALQEIASLLRRRVQQQDEMAERTEKRMEEIRTRDPATSNIDQIREDAKQRTDNMSAMLEKRRKETQLEKAHLQEEERQFKQRLLAELERHNALLDRLLSRLT